MYYINKDRLASSRGRGELNKNQVSAMIMGKGEAGNGFKMPSPKRAVGIVPGAPSAPGLEIYGMNLCSHTRSQQSRKCDELTGALRNIGNICMEILGRKWAVGMELGWKYCCEGTVRSWVLLSLVPIPRSCRSWGGASTPQTQPQGCEPLCP